MGNRSAPRRKGLGGLYVRTQKVWNEAKGEFETVEVVQATKEIRHPDNPEIRKRITGTGRTSDDALKRLDKNIRRYYQKLGLEQAGIPVPSRSKSGQSVEEYLLAWHSSISPGTISDQLRIKYLQHLKNHVIPHIGKLPLTELTHHHLGALFYETLPAKRKVKAGEELDEPLLGANARLNIYKTLSIALKMAVKTGVLNRNPLELVKAPRYEAPQENIPQMMHIAQSMFRHLKEKDPKAFNHFLPALLGLRRGERLGLQFSDLVLTGATPKLTIRSQLARDTGKGLHIKHATKSGKPRTVALGEPWLESFKYMKAERKRQLKLEGFNPEPEFADLIFLQDNGKPYDLNADNDWWQEINATYNAKYPPIRGHALRHIAATMMADNGVDREVAQAILGHESEAIAYYYRRITAEKQSSQVANYGKALAESIAPKTKRTKNN